MLACQSGLREIKGHKSQQLSHKAQEEVVHLKWESGWKNMRQVLKSRYLKQIKSCVNSPWSILFITLPCFFDDLTEPS